MYEYFEEMENDSFLEHHGILGQKWGIRRFQNYDGTLKNAGKKRRSEDRVKKRAERKAARVEKKEAKAQAKAEKAKADLEAAKKRAIANGDVDMIMKLRGSMTSEELKDAAARAGYLSSISTKMPKKQSLIDRVASGAKTIQGITENIQKTQASISAIRKEMGLDVKSILNDSDDSGGSKADSDGPDIFDRIKETTGKIAKDAAAKANEKYQEHKFQKDLQKLKDEKASSAISEFMNNIDKSGPKKTPAAPSNVDLPPLSLPWSSSVSNKAANTKISDVPKPSRNTQRTIDRLIRKGEGVGDVSISQVNDELLKRNNSRLGL